MGRVAREHYRDVAGGFLSREMVEWGDKCSLIPRGPPVRLNPMPAAPALDRIGLPGYINVPITKMARIYPNVLL